jgi:N-acetylglucosaminyldiphosphoundecaprenol N-acetyl-beta-D-mannosaminyltransferase
MAAHTGRLSAPVLHGVGAAFNIHAGLLPQAPRWMQRSGLEWLYRLSHEPRLTGRYLRNNPRFLLEILLRPPRIRSSEIPNA